MKFNFRSYWWVTFLALNLMSSKAIADEVSSKELEAREIRQKYLVAPRPADGSTVLSPPSHAGTLTPPSTSPSGALVEALANVHTVPGVPIPKARLKALIPDLDLEDEVDENNNLVLKGTVPRCAQGNLLIKHRANFRSNALILSFIDKEGKFQECLDRCERGELRTVECEKIPLSSLATIPGQSKDPLDIVIANSDGSYDPEPLGRLLSSEDAELEVLAWQAENCRGQKDGLTADQKVAELLFATKAIGKLDKRGYFKGEEDFRDEQLKEIKSLLTEAQKEQVLNIMADIENVGEFGFETGLAKVGDLDKVRKKLAAFAKTNAGPGVSDVISQAYRRIAELDLELNAHSGASVSDYLKAERRVRDDLKSASKLRKNLSAEERQSLGEFVASATLHKTEYMAIKSTELHTRDGEYARSIFGGLAAEADRQLQIASQGSRCQVMGNRLSPRLNGTYAPTGLNSYCASLSSNQKHLKSLVQYQRQAVEYAADQVRLKEEQDIFEQIKEDQKQKTAEIAALNVRAAEMAQASVANRVPSQFPNGQLPVGATVLGNGQIRLADGQIVQQQQLMANNQLNPNSFGMQPPRALVSPPRPLPSRNLFPASSSAIIGPTIGPTQIGI